MSVQVGTVPDPKTSPGLSVTPREAYEMTSPKVQSI